MILNYFVCGSTYLLFFFVVNSVALKCETISAIPLLNDDRAASAVFFGFCDRRSVRFDAVQHMRMLQKRK